MLKRIDRLAIFWINWRRHREVERSPELKDFRVEHISINKDSVDITASSPKGTVAWLANELARLLIKENAKNYVEMDMLPSMDVADRPVRITVQWVDGESPAAKAVRLEMEIEKLKPQTQNKQRG